MPALHPTQRGETYIALMRDLAEAIDDPLLHDHHQQELDRTLRPLTRMTTPDLQLVLEGIHDALQDVLDDLISARNRAQHTVRQPRSAHSRHEASEATR